MTTTPFLAGRTALGPVPPDRLRGLALLADDVGLRSGTGAEVRGPARTLATGVLSRPQALPLLSGEGVEVLAQRCRAVSLG